MAASRRLPRERVDQTASWPAILAWGAGLILTAIAAGAVTGDDATPLAVRVIGVPLTLVGLATISWGVLSLTRGSIVAPRAVIAGSIVGIGLGVAALAADPAGVSIGAVAAASALLLGLAMLVAFRIRRPVQGARTGVVGILAAAVVVAALTGPAIAATSSARLTADNGGVPVVVPTHH